MAQKQLRLQEQQLEFAEKAEEAAQASMIENLRAEKQAAKESLWECALVFVRGADPILETFKKEYLPILSFLSQLGKSKEVGKPELEEIAKSQKTINICLQASVDKINYVHDWPKLLAVCNDYPDPRLSAQIVEKLAAFEQWKLMFGQCMDKLEQEICRLLSVEGVRSLKLLVVEGEILQLETAEMLVDQLERNNPRQVIPYLRQLAIACEGSKPYAKRLGEVQHRVSTSFSLDVATNPASRLRSLIKAIPILQDLSRLLHDASESACEPMRRRLSEEIELIEKETVLISHASQWDDVLKSVQGCDSLNAIASFIPDAELRLRKVMESCRDSLDRQWQGFLAQVHIAFGHLRTEAQGTPTYWQIIFWHKRLLDTIRPLYSQTDLLFGKSELLPHGYDLVRAAVSESERYQPRIQIEDAFRNAGERQNSRKSQITALALKLFMLLRMLVLKLASIFLEGYYSVQIKQIKEPNDNMAKFLIYFDNKNGKLLLPDPSTFRQFSDPVWKSIVRDKWPDKSFPWLGKIKSSGLSVK